MAIFAAVPVAVLVTCIVPISNVINAVAANITVYEFTAGECTSFFRASSVLDWVTILAWNFWN